MGVNWLSSGYRNSFIADAVCCCSKHVAVNMLSTTADARCRKFGKGELLSRQHCSGQTERPSLWLVRLFFVFPIYALPLLLRMIRKAGKLITTLSPLPYSTTYRPSFITKRSLPANKRHLKNVGPIRHSEPPHAALPFTRCRYCRVARRLRIDVHDDDDNDNA